MVEVALGPAILGLAGAGIYVPFLGLRPLRNAARLHYWVGQRDTLARLGLRHHGTLALTPDGTP